MTYHKSSKKTITGMIALAAFWLLSACSQSQPEAPEQASASAHAEHDSHSEMLQLSDAELAEFGIEIDTASAGTVQQHRDLTGEIVIDPDRLAHIIPRFPGIVKKVHKKIGDRVSAGDVLAIIESNESLAPYEITSLIDGTIIEMHLTKGEAVNDNSHDIIIADLSYVWADLAVFQKDLEHVQVGQRATISAGESMPPFTGKVSYISPTMSEAKRTATARVIVANPNGHWRPGLFVNAEVVTAAIEVPVAVPKSALERFENRTVVFVKTPDGFRPQPVSIGRENHVAVEIRAGLQPGEIYVAKNGFTLKAELEKGAFGDGHAH
ncbi:MAG: efflux RND transporter periplasmic adaptor subunit [Calditrichia bacterium]